MGLDIGYHQAREELAKLSKLADAGDVPRVDIEAAVNETLDCLSKLENFENLPAATQKAFFGRFVERIDLEFEKVMTALKRGLLKLSSPLPTSPGLGLVGSGGGI